MILWLIAIAMLIAVVVTPIRAIVLVKGRAYWAARWRVARLSTKGFALVGWGLIAIAACEWLAIWVLILIKVSDRGLLGRSGQAGLTFYIVLAGIGITMFVALVVGELLMVPLRLSKPQEDAPHGQAAATSAGSTTPAGPRST